MDGRTGEEAGCTVESPAQPAENTLGVATGRLTIGRRLVAGWQAAPDSGKPRMVLAFVSDARRPGPEGTPNRPQVINLPHKSSRRAKKGMDSNTSVGFHATKQAGLTRL
jgi:hypothetical protein